MSLDADELYALLPAVYRTRDAAAGGQLRALFGVLAAQSDIVAGNIRQLYDDLFIETCEPWVIPYIGDLIGYNSVYELASVTDSRAEVANTIGARRRKGTRLALQQVAIDVSGRAAVVVEEFGALITTESMRYVRPGHTATVDLRDGRAMRLLGAASANGIADSPFDRANRTIDVRRIAPRVRAAATPDPTPLHIALHGPGRANLPDAGVHLWRWQAFQVTGTPAFAVGGGRYKFSPLGNDMPLFSPLRLPESFTALLTRDNVPQPIARDELAGFYASGAILLVADGVPVDGGQVGCANLADRPGGAWCTVADDMIAIDPELGRIQFAADVPVPQSLELSYWYGFPAPIGGGPYDRTPSLSAIVPGGAGGPGFSALVGSAGFPTLESAVTGWNGYAGGGGGGGGAAPANPTGVITLPGFAALTIDVTGTNTIQLPPGASLAIIAGQPDPAVGPNAVNWKNSLVTATGDIAVAGLAGTVSQTGTTPPAGQLLMSGICLAGQLLVSGAACSVLVSDSTLVPGTGLLSDGSPARPGEASIVVTATGASLVLNRVISGPVAADESGSTRICASVVDAGSPTSVAYAGPDLVSAGPDLRVEDATIVGKVRARTLTLASNSIFYARLVPGDPWQAAVMASRRQAGCVRFCVLPFDSITPRRYECLPPDQASEPALEPRFITLRYGHPGYALLSGDCPMAIWTGADNGSQLGAYLQAQETEAVSNVALRAPEYLPARLESGVFLHPSRAVPQGPQTPQEPPVAGSAEYEHREYGFTGMMRVWTAERRPRAQTGRNMKGDGT